MSISWLHSMFPLVPTAPTLSLTQHHLPTCMEWCWTSLQGIRFTHSFDNEPPCNHHRGDYYHELPLLRSSDLSRVLHHLCHRDMGGAASAVVETPEAELQRYALQLPPKERRLASRGTGWSGKLRSEWDINGIPMLAFWNGEPVAARNWVSQPNDCRWIFTWYVPAINWVMNWQRNFWESVTGWCLTRVANYRQNYWIISYHYPCFRKSSLVVIAVFLPGLGPKKPRRQTSWGSEERREAAGAV